VTLVQLVVWFTDLNSGYFSRVMDLVRFDAFRCAVSLVAAHPCVLPPLQWSQFKQSSLTKLRDFKKAKAKSMDAVVGLESFRKSLLPECREWTKTLCVVTKLR
jgi:hypothetical protein